MKVNLSSYPTSKIIKQILELKQAYTLVGPPVKGPVLAPLAVYSSTTIYIYLGSFYLSHTDTGRSKVHHPLGNCMIALPQTHPTSIIALPQTHPTPILFVPLLKSFWHAKSDIRLPYIDRQEKNSIKILCCFIFFKINDILRQKECRKKTILKKDTAAIQNNYIL